MPPEWELPSRIELYRQANRTERVARESARDAADDVIETMAWACLAASWTLIIAGWFRDRGGEPRP